MGKLILERNANIKNSYTAKIKNHKTQLDIDIVIADLAKEHEIGGFYIRSILKEQGVVIDRKKQYKRKDYDKLINRNIEIITLYKANTEIDVIAKNTNITSTRVRQIIRDVLGKQDNTSIITDKFEEVKILVSSGIPYHQILDTIGSTVIKQIKYNFNFNVFKNALEVKEKNIINMFNSGISPKDIAEKFKMTRNYVYIILYKHGIKTGISLIEKEKRNSEIYKLHVAGKTVMEIHKTFSDITQTMIRIIIKHKSVQLT